jgi:protein-L-isoaspartate O-methyltransferase
MDSNINLTNYLRDTNVLKSKSIIDAFYKIDRKDFIIEEYKNFAYIDRPL